MEPPHYTFDRDRLTALSRFAILDTPPERGFDDIVELAALICETPVALVSLVSEDRQWFKARIGFDACQTDLNSSVCAHALIEPDLLVVPDLTRDARTRNNPLVTGDPFIRFYAGAPLRTAGGHVLGSLCAIDTRIRPGGLTDAQAIALRTLARQVVAQLELRLAVAQRDALLAEQKAAEIRRNGLLEIGDRLRDATTIGEVTRAAAKVAGETLQVARAAFGRFDEGDEVVEIEPDWTAEGVVSAAGRHRLADYGDNLLAGVLSGQPLVITDVTTDPATAGHIEPLLALDIRSLVNMPVIEHGRTVAMLIVHARQPRAWAPEVLAYLGNIADRIETAVARLRAEAQQRLLNDELSHRMKNTMALVQAIASQTLKNVPDKAPVKAFSDRLLALSMAHDVLLQQDWRSAPVRSIVETAIRIFDDVGRFDVSGGSVPLGSRSALSLALLLHELTTNAAKYGALANDSGRVQIAWTIEDADGEAELRLRWRESGGPAVAPPSRQGFGSRLLKMGLAGTGGAQLHYHPAGVEAEFSVSLAELQT
ncbi:HWE histidine kinase domain-containing protein [Rhodopseudomonas palustris]|uniref:sensor histidine kinase n=1 Tax=Rhodopseudomonas palustris TaxID=1076 RepID=UPI002ACED075|nr:GAF domain-containing protein [Rhodopseudomonas palustris]WQG98347.1 HWE histidine kinase domain-containing protein [Rhodopseudomonas palustris]